jgi:hypothetical protein
MPSPFPPQAQISGEVGLLQTKELEDNDAAYIVSTTAQRLKRLQKSGAPVSI